LKARFGFRVVKRTGSIQSGAAFGAVAAEGEIWPQGGQAQWQLSVPSSIRSVGSVTFRVVKRSGSVRSGAAFRAGQREARFGPRMVKVSGGVLTTSMSA